jgi:cyclopropane-fatty-acyl-phospholipid synthase
MKTIEQNNIHLKTGLYPASSMSIQGSDAAAGHRIISVLFDGYQGPVAIQLWDGSLFRDAQEIQCVLHIHHPGVLRDLILRRDLVRLAEAFIAGYVDVTGDLEVLFQLESHLKTLKPDYRVRLRLLLDALRLPSIKHKNFQRQVKAGENQQQNSREAISHHYDVGNEFYRLWLDRKMVYSCAYFRDTEQTLDEAQQDKLDYLCRKLRLQPGQTLLDIGCGWGALAIWAAEHYGVKVHGVTLSNEQLTLANARIKQAGLEHLVTIELRDYRDLIDEVKYDRIVSVGMFEHIGVKNFPVYFGKIKKLLKPGGLFLNHGITIKDNDKRSALKRFINQYIFPDGELARISDVNDAMENAGFEIIDIESLRRHYALTLRRWVQTLQSKVKQATALTSSETYRLWQLYMSGFAYYFDEGTVNVHQILVAHQHDRLPNPLRREDLYI